MASGRGLLYLMREGIFLILSVVSALAITACGAAEVSGSKPIQPVCGDGICNSAENCSSCPADCGTCGSGQVQTTITLYPAAGQIPTTGTQSLTALIYGVANKDVTWSASGGTVTGTGNSVAFTATSPGVYTITATSQADGTQAATSTVTVTAPPSPATGHPRLWITSADLPRLQSWAVSSNPVWVSMVSASAEATSDTDAHWSWSKSGDCTGFPDSGWGDMGASDGYLNFTTEAYAQWFAFMSLIDPNVPARATEARHACDMMMWMLNHVCPGGHCRADTSSDSNFLWAQTNSGGYDRYVCGDRMRQFGVEWYTALDWIYPILSANDRATIAATFQKWGHDYSQCAHTGYPVGERPDPVGTVNSSALLSDKVHARWAGNNYFWGHTRNLIMQSLLLDPADDGGSSCNLHVVNADGTAGCARAYLSTGIGSWLYMVYAGFEDANVASTVLGIPTSNPALGQMSGGVPMEGTEYGASLGYLAEGLMALHSAGYDDPAIWGPGVNLRSSSVWSLVVQAFASTIVDTPVAVNTGNNTSKVYQFAGYGGDDYGYAKTAYIDTFAPIAMQAATMGDNTLAQNSRWIVENVLGQDGNDAGNWTRLIGLPWGGPFVSEAILDFLSLDPTAAAPTDPRPTFQLDFIAPASARILARSSWSSGSDSFLTTRCNWANIDHQVGDCGQFEFYRKGEWLLKAWIGQPSYGLDSSNSISVFKNMLGLQNGTVDETGTPYEDIPTYGGQWIWGENGIDAASAEDPSHLVSSGPGYIYFYADATNMYNSLGGSLVSSQNQVVAAQRSLLWSKPDLVFIYDRVTSSTAGLFKNFNLVTPQAASTAATTAMITSAGGQILFATALLPASVKITTQSVNWGPGHGQAITQTNSTRIIFTATGAPSDTRFLNVLQAKDGASPQTAPTLVRSSSGTNFEGAVLGTTLALFKKTASDALTTMTYPASGARMHYVSELTPNTTYSLSGAGVPASAATDSAGVLTFAASGTGSITIH